MDHQSKESALKREAFNQARIVTLFALVGMAISTAMGCIAFFNQSYSLASVLLLTSFVYFIAYCACKFFNNTKVSSSLTLYTLFLLMFYLVYTGGVENTGPLWIFIVAPVSLFLRGFKRGLFDLAIFGLSISIIMFTPTDLISHTIYSTEFKLRLIYSFLTVTFLSALYEYSRERAYKELLILSSEYQQLAHLDPLTQLSNRRDALRVLERERIRSIRNNEPVSIILCDVDHFKQVNDRYGHNAGDAVLKDLASIFSQKIREQDYVARWGGEEFLFILPQTSASNAQVIAHKIKDEVANSSINFEMHNIKFTVSMGIEQVGDNQTTDEIINRADKYLFQAKNAGRNQIFPYADLAILNNCTIEEQGR